MHAAPYLRVLASIELLARIIADETCVPQVQEAFRAALQTAATEAAKADQSDPIPAPSEVAQLVEEAMFGFYGELCWSLRLATPLLR